MVVVVPSTMGGPCGALVAALILAAALGPAAATGPAFLLYVPHMGRFGNQARDSRAPPPPTPTLPSRPSTDNSAALPTHQVDQLLGTLAFATATNRTLVVPPLVEYTHDGATFTPLESLFTLAAPEHAVVSLADFLANPQLETIWPASERHISCAFPAEPSLDSSHGRDRDGSDDGSGPADVCGAHSTEPNRAFWQAARIAFAGHLSLPPLDCNWHTASVSDAPALSTLHCPGLDGNALPDRVLALTHSPAPYPLPQGLAGLHRLLQWRPEVAGRALADLDPATRAALAEHRLLAIHLRGRTDFASACLRYVIGQVGPPAATTPSQNCVAMHEPCKTVSALRTTDGRTFARQSPWPVRSAALHLHNSKRRANMQTRHSFQRPSASLLLRNRRGEEKRQAAPPTPFPHNSAHSIPSNQTSGV